MRYRIRTVVEGSSSIEGELEFDCGRHRFRLGAGENRRIVWIEVEVQVADYQEYLPRLTRVSENQWSLVSAPNPHHQDLIDLLQYVESIGAFWLGIRRLHWENPEADWVPESNEEKEQIHVRNLRVSRKYPTPPTPVGAKLIGEVLDRRSTHQYLTIPMAFFREGMNEFEQFRYIQAFFNFYFFLESLFGRGGKNQRVIEHFIASPSLCNATAEALAFLQGEHSRWERLKQHVTHDGHPSVEVTLASVVDLRGRLHHFSIGNTRLQGHPLNHREFEWCAYLLVAICLKLVPKLLTAPPPSDIGSRVR